MQLPGLRADNVLGFLAALGVCRILECLLAWERVGPLWVAAIRTEPGEMEVIDRLLERCRKLPPPVDRIDDAVTCGVDKWRAFAEEYPDWAAALGNDDISPKRPDGIEIIRSPLLMSRGGGRQAPLDMVRKLCRHITREDIASALCGPWKRHKNLGLRLDPAEHRSHADMWNDPSKKKKADEIVAWGPTILAFHGFLLLPTISADWSAMFAPGDWHRLRWPIWEEYLSHRAVTAKIATAEPAFTGVRQHQDQGNWSMFPAIPVRHATPDSR